MAVKTLDSVYYVSPTPAILIRKNRFADVRFDANQKTLLEFITSGCLQLGFTGSQCEKNFLVAFQREDLIPLRWFYFSIYLVLTLLGIFCIAQHAYYGMAIRFTHINVSKMAAVSLVVLAYLCQLIRIGTNPFGERSCTLLF